VGNALAFAAAWLSARSQGLPLLLRIEDVDTTRARQSLIDGIHRDLAWLGLTYDHETPPQSTRDYRPWLERLDTYHCACTRKLLAERPCPCRDARHTAGSIRWRLPRGSVTFHDRRMGRVDVDPTRFGDPVLVRRDGVVAYTLAVVVDDLVDGVTEVVRGADLLEYTAVQIRLWEAFGATPPTWLHGPLLMGTDGRKLSKSTGSTGVSSWRELGFPPAELWAHLLPMLGLEGGSLAEAIPAFDPTGGSLGPLQWPPDGYQGPKEDGCSD
jgi:glutamyl/glutaminyl-tRNA synthetase